MILLIILGVGGCKPSATPGELITVDVSASYPQKELILQDFMDVEYIPLESNDEFVTQGHVLAVGNQYIIVKNWHNDGDIFVFDRKTGKGVRKINKKGQGDGEYTFINGVALDEENQELFVNCTPAKKICVYDLSGNFKRSFAHTEGTEYYNIFSYDKEHLIRYDASMSYKDGKKREDRGYHAIISKQDGSVVRDLYIPFEVIKAPAAKMGEGLAVTSIRTIIPNQDYWLLVETSSDTVYSYVAQEDRLAPFLVKTPSIDPEVLLTLGTLTGRYYFIQTIKKEFDFETGRGFPKTDLMYDRQEKTLFSIVVFNGDFVQQQKVDMYSNPINHTIAAFQTVAANQLVEAYENDGLKGPLKEIAVGLDEDSNPVLLLMKYKK